MPKKRSSKKQQTRAAKKKARSRPIDQLHQPPLRDEIERALLDRPAGLKSIRKIHEHFKLAERGISYGALAKYARTHQWRKRLHATGTIVTKLLGDSSPVDSQQLCDAAHLKLMAAVIQRLQEDSENIPTELLVKLSKIIAEQRTARNRERSLNLKEQLRTPAAPSDDGPLQPKEGLPDNFDEVVKRIYGVQLDENPSEARASTSACSAPTLDRSLTVSAQKGLATKPAE